MSICLSTVCLSQDLALAKGTPLANLHLTIAQKFGAEISSLNNVSTGTLSGLFV